MKWTKGSTLRNKEQEAIAAIRAYRHDLAAGLIPGPPNAPAQIMRSLIDANHGHLDLRLQPIAAELGVSMKTLQRAFRAAYAMTMSNYQLEARITFARQMLSLHPRPKLGVIANQLGYSDAREFGRRFRAHTHTIPSRWRPDESDPKKHD